MPKAQTELQEPVLFECREQLLPLVLLKATPVEIGRALEADDSSHILSECICHANILLSHKLPPWFDILDGRLQEV